MKKRCSKNAARVTLPYWRTKKKKKEKKEEEKKKKQKQKKKKPFFQHKNHLNSKCTILNAHSFFCRKHFSTVLAFKSEKCMCVFIRYQTIRIWIHYHETGFEYRLISSLVRGPMILHSIIDHRDSKRAL